MAYASNLSSSSNPTSSSSRDVIARDESVNRDNSTNANNYVYGYCTWYVASQKDVPNSWGNASQWLYSAQASGYATGQTPQEGAIIVTAESGWGHVGIVENVTDTEITISEMNYLGWGIVNTRDINLNSSIINGFIY